MLLIHVVPGDMIVDTNISLPGIVVEEDDTNRKIVDIRGKPIVEICNCVVPLRVSNTLELILLPVLGMVRPAMPVPRAAAPKAAPKTPAPSPARPPKNPPIPKSILGLKPPTVGANAIVEVNIVCVVMLLVVTPPVNPVTDDTFSVEIDAALAIRLLTNNVLNVLIALLPEPGVG
jgi:hypothetical protein